MVTSEHNQATHGGESPINATLLKLIHHELGNGLAVLAGYRHLLQRNISLQRAEGVVPDPEVWRRHNEQLLGYLQAMHEREALLNDFLAQLREISPVTKLDHFCHMTERADLREMLKRVVQRLAPLFPARTLHLQVPAQPLFLSCDVFWLGVVLEHIVNHTITAHTTSAPIELCLELEDHPHPVRNACLAMHIETTLPEIHPEHEALPELWSQALKQEDQVLCSTLCNDVIQEHGGHLWWRRGAGQKATLFLTLPLAGE